VTGIPAAEAARPAAPEVGRARRPVAVAVAGALCITPSATLVGLAAVAPATAAFFRCVYALPLLGVLAWRERRRLGARTARQVSRAAIAGVFFAFDLVLWNHLQVVFVGLGAWAAFSERPPIRLMAALPVVLAGVVLISGVVGSGAYGPDPRLGVVYGMGTSIAYAIFILVLRGAGGESVRVAGPLFEVAVVTAVASAALGPVAGGIDLVPTWPATGWLVLLAVTTQVVGWTLITWAWRLLPAAQTSLLLLIQPVGSVALSAAVLGERPSAWQLTGCTVVLAGVVWGSLGGRPAEDLRASGRRRR
jgi:drug/metabolite transporter (DMT)-like permease